MAVAAFTMSIGAVAIALIDGRVPAFEIMVSLTVSFLPSKVAQMMLLSALIDASYIIARFFSPQSHVARSTGQSRSPACLHDMFSLVL